MTDYFSRLIEIVEKEEKGSYLESSPSEDIEEIAETIESDISISSHAHQLIKDSSQIDQHPVVQNQRGGKNETDDERHSEFSAKSDSADTLSDSEAIIESHTLISEEGDIEGVEVITTEVDTAPHFKQVTTREDLPNERFPNLTPTETALTISQEEETKLVETKESKPPEIKSILKSTEIQKESSRKSVTIRDVLEWIGSEIPETSMESPKDVITQLESPSPQERIEFSPATTLVELTDYVGPSSQMEEHQITIGRISLIVEDSKSEKKQPPIQRIPVRNPVSRQSGSTKKLNRYYIRP